MIRGLQLKVADGAEPIEVCEYVYNEEKSKERLRSKNLQLVFAKDEREPSRELVRRRAFLKRRNDERSYWRMVANVHPKAKPPEERVAASFKFQAIVGANMIVAPTASFFICYTLARSIVKKHTSRMAIGLGGGVIMLVIEMILFIVRSYTIEQTSKKEKKKAKLF